VIRRLALVAALAVAALGVLTGSSSAGTAEVRCMPNKSVGVRIVNHVTVVVYCGSAKLTIKSAGKTTRYSGGACYKVAGSLNVGLGKLTTLGHTPLYRAVLLVIPAVGDGTYRLAVMTVQQKGKQQAANKVRAVVMGNRSKGTFSGKFQKGAKFTGSFTCK
jgi:hypothetical protein